MDGAPQEVDFSEVFSPDRVANNARAINHTRVFVAIAAGCAAGILGLESAAGMIPFVLSTLALSLCLYLSMDARPAPYFKHATDVWTEGISQAIMSYILFWTLLYDVVHIY